MAGYCDVAICMHINYTMDFHATSRRTYADWDDIDEDGVQLDETINVASQACVDHVVELHRIITEQKDSAQHLAAVAAARAAPGGRRRRAPPSSAAPSTAEPAVPTAAQDTEFLSEASMALDQLLASKVLLPACQVVRPKPGALPAPALVHALVPVLHRLYASTRADAAFGQASIGSSIIKLTSSAAPCCAHGHGSEEHEHEHEHKPAAAPGVPHGCRVWVNHVGECTLRAGDGSPTAPVTPGTWRAHVHHACAAGLAAAWYVLGSQAAGSHDWGAVLDACRQSLAFADTAVQCWMLRGKACAVLGGLPLAELHFDRALMVLGVDPYQIQVATPQLDMLDNALRVYDMDVSLDHHSPAAPSPASTSSQHTDSVAVWTAACGTLAARCVSAQACKRWLLHTYDVTHVWTRADWVTVRLAALQGSADLAPQALLACHTEAGVLFQERFFFTASILFEAVLRAGASLAATLLQLSEPAPGHDASLRSVAAWMCAAVSGVSMADEAGQQVAWAALLCGYCALNVSVTLLQRRVQMPAACEAAQGAHDMFVALAGQLHAGVPKPAQWHRQTDELPRVIPQRTPLPSELSAACIATAQAKSLVRLAQANTELGNCRDALQLAAACHELLATAYEDAAWRRPAQRIALQAGKAIAKARYIAKYAGEVELDT